MVEKPEFLPITELPITQEQAFQAGLYIVELFVELGREPQYGEIQIILCGDHPRANEIKNNIARNLSSIAGSVTNKDYKDLPNYLRRRGEELNLL